MKKFLIFAAILIVIITGVYLYLYKSHRDISSEDAISVHGLSVVKEFEQNEEAANKKYLDKTIQIEGTISNIDQATKTLVLDNKIFASLEQAITLEFGKKITIKGRMIGYDSLLGEVKIDQCSLIE